MQRNLRLAGPLSFISMLFFPSATWLFYFSQYLNYQQIVGIMGIGALVSLTMEIPTGVFADYVGRKWAVALSYLLFSLAMVGTVLVSSYWGFLLITIVNALVNCLYSGSMEALIYDTLLVQKEEKKFDVWTSRMESLTWIGLFVSSVAGGYLFALNPKAPYLLQAVITLIAAGIALLLTEPKIDSVKYQLRELATSNLTGFKELFANKKIIYLTLILSVLGLGYYVASDILNISQVKQYGLDTRMVGWVFGIGYLISAVTAHVYPFLRKKFGEMSLVWAAATAMLISFVLAKFIGPLAGVVLIILRLASSTTFRNSRSVIINAQISSRNRATTLSTLTLISELPYAISASLIGWYIDKTGPNQFAWILGIGIIILLVVTKALNLRPKFAKLRPYG